MGLLGLLLSGFGVFPSPWPWVVVLGFGIFSEYLPRILRSGQQRSERVFLDLMQARALAEEAGLSLRKQVATWEQRIDGTLTPEEAREVRASQNRIVQDMAELRALVEEVAKEQRARAFAAPFTEGP